MRLLRRLLICSFSFSYFLTSKYFQHNCFYRIIIFVLFSLGKYSTIGGLGNSAGASGTVYYTDNNIGLDQRPRVSSAANNKTKWGYSFRKLVIDNENRNKDVATIIMEPSYQYEFDEIEAKNHVLLQIDGSNATLTVHKFRGDRTGLFHVFSGQTMYVEVVESNRGYTIAPVSYKLDAGSTVHYPSSLTVLGTRCDFNGKIVGVDQLILAKGAGINVGKTAITAKWENGSYILVSDPGNLTFGEMIIQNKAKVDFTSIIGKVKLTVNHLKIKYHGLLLMNLAEIVLSNMEIESRGTLQITTCGHQSEKGPGAGRTSGGIGGGAGYGGEGGAATGSTLGGGGYGLLFRPVDLGSGGGSGSGTGGQGGGSLMLAVGKDLYLDGSVLLHGANGAGSNAGGGSGGSLLVTCLNISGHGNVDISGGNSTGSGGGGSGGRIGIHINFKHKYGGTFKTVGGSGNTYGSSGTVYIEETGRSPQYADIKYDRFQNKTLFLALHKYLFIDNEDHVMPWSTVLIDQSRALWEFDELHLVRHSNLIAHRPHLSPNVTIIAHKFLGDGTGRVHVKIGQYLFVEVVESVSNETTAPCSFLVDIGGEILFPSTVYVRGTRSIINGRITGVEYLFIASGGQIEFSSSSQTAKIENRIYVHISENGNFTFSTVTVKRNAHLIFNKVNDTLKLYSGDLRVKYGGKLTMNHGFFYTSYATVESKGIVFLDGTGFLGEQGKGHGTTVNSVGMGAGYGGEGGGSVRGKAYGSVFSPEELGSGGGHGLGVGGSGGGYLMWTVGRHLKINGLVTAKGGNGSGTNAGGGSGGSIFIKTTNMTGHGELNVEGGKGSGMGGCGSGGRIAIHCRWRYKYGGKIKDKGGQSVVSGVNLGAAAGTGYKEENYRPLAYRIRKHLKKTNDTILRVDHTYLHVDNEGFNVPGATYLMEENTIVYEFDELELTGYSRLVAYHPQNESVNVTVHRFIGDKTGQFHIFDRQKIFVEVVESLSNITEAPCSYLIEVGGEILLPSEVHLYGTRSTFKGMISGIERLFISYGANVDVYSTAQTALMDNQAYVFISEPGNLSIAELTVKRGGNLELRKVLGDMRLTVDKLLIHYQGKMYVNHGAILSTYGHLYSQGLLSVDVSGYASQSGPGSGGNVAVSGHTVGTGAGHGGQGGYANDLPTSSKAYDSVYKPVSLGSGGGSGTGSGGSGGGHLTWHISQWLELNGVLTGKGGDALSGNAGGGSGGSILIFVTNMTGHGVINIGGGSGHSLGGGGAGGRVGIHCRWKYRYGGQFVTRGGNGRKGGAAGTVYKEENLRELDYRVKKYDKSTNSSFLAVDHTMLFVSNAGYDVDVATVLMEEGRISYEFDEVELTGYSRMILYHPSNSLVNVTAHRFIGDRTGQLHVRGNQTVYVEYVESVMNRTEAPCSFKIDQMAEMVLPFEFHVQGVRTVIDGRMTGVHHLFIEHSASIEFSETASTALIENRTYTDISNKGNASIANIIVKNGGELKLTRRRDVIVGMKAELFEIKYRGRVNVNHAVIYSTFGDVETEGKLNLDAAAIGEGILIYISHSRRLCHLLKTKNE